MAPIDSDRWTQLYKRLCIVAAALARSVPSVFDGISVMDLPGETLLALFESPDGLGVIQPEALLSRSSVACLRKSCSLGFGGT